MGKWRGCINVPLINSSWKYNAETRKKEVVKEDNLDFITQVGIFGLFRRCKGVVLGAPEGGNDEGGQPGLHRPGLLGILGATYLGLICALDAHERGGEGGST